ncbi:hypothetical protein PORCRE_227 [Porphyromonas crevioricanis JCM 15906]|uniref:Uncharacterized protein n=1 Tax=Porphyromonas crevioricanis JCM 15906 TaxID=1305617 RepID=S4N9B8_9PORP|nr:hypothetical protein PORCRE_227 [Porphyromonas crevioricanis JCM 15906]GAD07936.1 hypothetical protein PORCAN_1565 [Porphyromonas crevioricanis JCM 13913]
MREKSRQLRSLFKTKRPLIYLHKQHNKKQQIKIICMKAFHTSP